MQAESFKNTLNILRLYFNSRQQSADSKQLASKHRGAFSQPGLSRLTLQMKVSLKSFSTFSISTGHYQQEQNKMLALLQPIRATKCDTQSRSEARKTCLSGHKPSQITAKQ